MRFKMTRLLEVAIPSSIALLLAGCFGSGSNTPTYDGTWTAVYADSAFTPPAAASGGAVTCNLPSPLPTLTLVNGAGSTSQTNTCTGTLAGGGTQSFIYNISVAVTTSTGAMKAVVNGSVTQSLSGQCVSANGCAAQAGTAAVVLTR